MRAPDGAVDVAVVRWPTDAVARALLAREGRPRVVVVDAGAAAPAPLDDLEDWLHEPVDPVELLTRTDALRRRVAARVVAPRLDDDGLLHFDGRWVVIPDAQLPMVALLVSRFGELVRTDELVAAYTGAGGTKNRSSIRTAIMRVRARVAEVGLTLEAARQRGVVLEVATTADG